jgi:hypothetical protein
MGQQWGILKRCDGFYSLINGAAAISVVASTNLGPQLLTLELNMRPMILFSLLFTLLSSSLTQAQLSWSKHSYAASGFRVERADFTGDGFPDLLVYGSQNSISILPNKGDGTMDSSRTFNLEQPLSDVALLDFNHDGKLDVAGCDGGNNLVILLGNGDGTLTLSQMVPVACGWITTADFNHDGNPDLAVGVPGFSNSNNQVIVYLGDGSGGISGTVTNDNVNLTSSNGDACLLDGFAKAADFTGDKIADIAITADCPNGTNSAAALIVGAGDNTGHFAFHKDVEFFFNANMALRLADLDQNGRQDIIGAAQWFAPHSANGGALLAFVGQGDGTFALKEIAAYSDSDQPGNTITAGAVVDLDGDGIKDGVVAVDSFDLSDNVTHSLRFFKGQSDGSYKLTQTMSLATGVRDIVWGDFDKNSRTDLALLRPASADVWLNTTSSAPFCAANTAPRTLSFCDFPAGSAAFRFVSSPLDNLLINAMQVYVDGTLKFETPDDLLNKNLQLGDGTHRVTVKAWDDRGAFSASTSITACSNTTNRTVKICSPQNGSTTGSSFHILASAATNLKFSEIQVYVGGVLKFRSSSQMIDFQATGFGRGIHHITVKGWDSNGSFSSSITVTVQ